MKTQAASSTDLSALVSQDHAEKIISILTLKMRGQQITQISKDDLSIFIIRASEANRFRNAGISIMMFIDLVRKMDDLLFQDKVICSKMNHASQMIDAIYNSRSLPLAWEDTEIGKRCSGMSRAESWKDWTGHYEKDKSFRQEISSQMKEIRNALGMA